jgi:predicted AAA+ superfamily ATPase
MELTPRKLAANILFALANSPVVFVNGPRQPGKSTLVRALMQKEFPAEYVSFDNATQMAAAAASPHAFLSSRRGPLIIDQVQMVPGVFRALKRIVDDLRASPGQPSNGRFPLTGSSDIMALPRLSDALVGRMSVKTLLPFAACEVFATGGTFLNRLFAADFDQPAPGAPGLERTLQAATYPEISGRPERRRSDWLEGYLTTILQRDVRMLSELEKIAVLPQLLRILAYRAGSLLNDAAIAREVGLNPVTCRNYRAALKAMFLIFEVRPWYRNVGKRLVKSAKGYLTDTLLLCHLMDWRLEDLRNRRPELFGRVTENFVAAELSKLLCFSGTRAELLHYRTSDNREVDFVLERPDGSLAAVEVRSSDTVEDRDFAGIRSLGEVVGGDLLCGVVLYAGDALVPFGKKLFAVPIQALWA